MEVSGRKVIKWANHSIDPGIFEEEMISDPEALGATIKQLLSSSGISERNATASVSGLFSLSRIIEVATPLGEPITEKAVLEEVQEVIPLPEDELYFSWQAIGMSGGSQQVLVVGIPRDTIDSEVQALRTAGINPRTLDLKSMALARAVQKEQALILNIEPTTIDTVMIVNGIIDHMRTVAWQYDDLSMEDRAEYLASSIELTVGFHDSHHPGSHLDPATPLFVTGHMSMDFTLLEELQARLDYPFESLEPPLEYPAHLPVSQYAVNIGLALKGTAAAKTVGQGNYSLPDMNLLPEGFRPWKPTTKQLQVFGALMAGLILLIPVYGVTSGAINETSKLKQEYNLVNTKLEQIQLAIKNREPLKTAIQDYTTIVDMGGGFTENLEVINSLAAGLGVHLRSVVHEIGSITISCQSDTYTSFRDFITALEESGQFLTPIPPPEGYPYTRAGTIKLEPAPPAE